MMKSAIILISHFSFLISHFSFNMSLTITSSPPFLATGEPVGIVHAPTECTVAQAAEFLDGPENLVNAWLDDGLIVFRLKNGERLVQWNSLLEFKKEQEWMHEGLIKIVRLSEEMGLYDD